MSFIIKSNFHLLYIQLILSFSPNCCDLRELQKLCKRHTKNQRTRDMVDVPHIEYTKFEHKRIIVLVRNSLLVYFSLESVCRLYTFYRSRGKTKKAISDVVIFFIELFTTLFPGCQSSFITIRLSNRRKSDI